MFLLKKFGPIILLQVTTHQTPTWILWRWCSTACCV